MNRPFLLRPTGKSYLWGGGRLCIEYAKDMEVFPLAESWECSAHQEGPSYAVGGIHDKESLFDIFINHPEYLGTHGGSRLEFPILIKLIDAKEDLSIQVHPSDEYAKENEDGHLGKTEMWYVLEAAKDARLYYGLNRDVTKADLRNAIYDGTVEKYLQKIPIKKNDIFFVEPGTIHAIGAGALIAEIQENSNLIYRLFDYNRVDKEGIKRPLHIEKALDVANLSKSVEPRQPMRVMRYFPGFAKELLCRCSYFEVHRLIISTNRRQKVSFQSDELSFRVLLCTEGFGLIKFYYEGKLEIIEMFKGDCVFVPANSVELSIIGKMQLLDVRS